MAILNRPLKCHMKIGFNFRTRAQNRVANIDENKAAQFDPLKAQKEAYLRYLQQRQLQIAQEEWRRRNQPTILERVADIFNVGSWFG